MSEQSLAPETLESDFGESESLFHYTSSRGLYGILQSGCLWATHYRFLNDSKEFYAAKDSLLAYVDKRIAHRLAAMIVNKELTLHEGASLRDLSSQFAVRFVEIFYGATLGVEPLAVAGMDAFVFSASRYDPTQDRAFSDGELLHWATYGQNGGYALQFSWQKIVAILRSEDKKYKKLPYVFEPVLYAAKGEVPEKLKKEYESFGDTAVRSVEFRVSDGEIGANELAQAGPAFVNIISRVKDSFFESEREARITIIRGKTPTEGHIFHPFQVRHANAVAIPYIELFKETLLGPETPLERILLGPHPENERRLFTLESYLRERKLDFVKVDVSNIPYVNVPGS